MSKENTVIASGSHDKSLKFWSLPSEWLEFKKKVKEQLERQQSEGESQAAVSLHKSGETKYGVNQEVKPKKADKKIEEAQVSEVLKVDKPKKKTPEVSEKVEESPKLEQKPEEIQAKTPDPVQTPEEDEDLSPKKEKPKNDKVNLFDSDGEEANEFK